MGIDIGLPAQKLVLIFFRVASILWLLPMFSGKSISLGFKACLSAAIAILVFEDVSLTNVPPLAGDPYYLALLVIKEILLGLAIGFFVRILFSTVYVVGEVVALQAGLGFAKFMDPYTNTQVSEISQTLNILALMVFFSLDAHHMVLRGLFLSFQELPLGGASLKGPFVEYLIHITGRVFTLGFKIGAPLIVTLFLVEISLGLLSRMVPQINIFVEGVPLKIMITIAMLSLSLSLLIPLIADLFKGMEGGIPRIIRFME
jgi:flagellar biosynthesis protein FliR